MHEKFESEFGVDFPPGTHILTKHLYCYKHGLTEETGALGKDGHFWEIVDLLWGKKNEIKRFIRNPWSEKMISAAHQHKYLSVLGCASGGKSDTYAVYAIVNWLSDPANTMVLITSTSLKESRGRIWGAVEEYINAAQKHFHGALPLKLVSSIGIIKLHDPTGEYKTSDRSAIVLIAGEKKKEKEAIGKMIGLKAERVFLIADELPELSLAILEAAYSNLDANPFFQLIGIGNPNSIYDPLGVFSTPKDGWNSINPDLDEWETEKGYCIRFDAYKSPNVLADRLIYRWLPTRDKIEEKKQELGEDSLAFWRMWRGYFCPSGGAETVVAEADIVGFNCDKPVKNWKDNKYIPVAFLDAGFTSGGDRSVVYFGKFGINADTDKETLEYTDYVLLFEDTTLSKEPRNFQIARKFKEICEQRGISPECAGCDDTGAAAFGDIVHTVWSREVTRINFGGAPSKMPISAHDKTPACDKYKNRVTEIWCVIRNYMRTEQIRGIGRDLAVELTARQMIHKKSGLDLKAQVETKEKMKSRTGGVSPDIADAALGLLDLVRMKFRFRTADRINMARENHISWKMFRKTLNNQMTRMMPVLDRTV